MHGVAFGYALTYLLDAVIPVSMLPGRTHLRSADNGQYDVPRAGLKVCRYAPVLRTGTSVKSLSQYRHFCHGWKYMYVEFHNTA